MRNCKEQMKQNSGRCKRWLTTSAYRKEPYDEKSKPANFHIYELMGVYGSLEGLFRTGLRAKRDIIRGAWDRLCKEQAHAI